MIYYKGMIMETDAMKKRRGDRRDARLLRDIDAIHFVSSVIYPNRCDNEAFISERIDLEKVSRYLAAKNAGNPDYKYNIFQVIVTVMLKSITLRPRMNYFIANNNLYARNDVSAAFIVKKKFEDKSEEGLAWLRARPEDTIDTLHERIREQITGARSGKKDSTDNTMDILLKLPRPISKAILHVLMWLDRHGKVPAAMVASDPYYSSVLLSNLGSIKLHAGYHHLTNWGTTSFFCIIGERKKRPFYDENGQISMRDSIDLGLTVDERIADGYYFSRTLALMRKLFEEPELLDRPLGEEVDF